MAKFNPKEHMTNLRGKDYLEVKWRLVWFRLEHPLGCVSTELVQADALIVVRATIIDEDGRVLATGYGSCAPAPGKVYSGRELEKAETAAIGRALAHAGYGTQFDADDDDMTHLADSPVERARTAHDAMRSAFPDADVSEIAPQPSGKPWNAEAVKSWKAMFADTPDEWLLEALGVSRYGEWKGDAGSATLRVNWYLGQQAEGGAE